jgi:hypothetical protein
MNGGRGEEEGRGKKREEKMMDVISGGCSDLKIKSGSIKKCGGESTP